MLILDYNNCQYSYEGNQSQTNFHSICLGVYKSHPCRHYKSPIDQLNGHGRLWMPRPYLPLSTTIQSNIRGKLLHIIIQNPNVSKSKQLHVDMFRCFVIHFKHILKIFLEWSIILPKSWTSIGHFSNSTVHLELAADFPLFVVKEFIMCSQSYGVLNMSEKLIRILNENVFLYLTL